MGKGAESSITHQRSNPVPEIGQKPLEPQITCLSDKLKELSDNSDSSSLGSYQKSNLNI